MAVKQRSGGGPGSGRSKEQFGRSGRRLSANKFAPYLLIAPFIIGFLGLAIFPILWSLLAQFRELVGHRYDMGGLTQLPLRPH